MNDDGVIIIVAVVFSLIVSMLGFMPHLKNNFFELSDGNWTCSEWKEVQGVCTESDRIIASGKFDEMINVNTSAIFYAGREGLAYFSGARGNTSDLIVQLVVREKLCPPTRKQCVRWVWSK